MVPVKMKRGGTPPKPAGGGARRRGGENPETRILKSILEGLPYFVRGVVLWRNNSGATRTQAGGFVRFGAVGSADLLGVLPPSGRLVALEVKQPGKKPTPAQVVWLESVKAAGAVAGVVTSLAEAVELVRAAMREDARGGQGGTDARE